MTRYRSDWPEIGLSSSLNENAFFHEDAAGTENKKEVEQQNYHGVILKWITSKNDFESRLYQFPIWELCLDINDSKGLILTDQMDSPLLARFVNEGISKLMASSNWGNAYISAKVVKGEPLHIALLQHDFQVVEHRSIHTFKIRDLKVSESMDPDKRICYTTLAAIPSSDQASYREQVLAICQESFRQGGYSRHFTDPFLFDRCPGIKYILEVMKLNFQYVEPDNFLLALDNGISVVCGFTVIGRRPGSQANIYTQWLSAVSPEYRRRGIYRGLTHFLSRTFPPDAQFSNVTHVENHMIQMAYEGSGRKHIADTVVIRRIL